jgi:hypothetical protein
MITKWLLSENWWEYEGIIFIESETLPITKMLDDGSCEMMVDGVRLTFDEEIRQAKVGD